MTSMNHGQMYMIGVPDQWKGQQQPAVTAEAAEAAARLRDDISAQAREYSRHVTVELEEFLLDTNHDDIGITKPFADEDGVEEPMRIVELYTTIDERIIVFVHSKSHGRTYGIIAGNVFSPMSLTGIYHEFDDGDDAGRTTISRMYHGLQQALALSDMGLPGNAIELDDEARANALAKPKG